MGFIHLNVHSQYSLLSGFIEFKKLLKRTQEHGMNAVALTDLGNLFGAVEFYRAAKSKDIKPIIGCEMYYTTGSHQDRTREPGGLRHVNLIAKNMEGYRNLCRLVSLGYFEGFYYRPRIDFELLKKHSEGLIATTSGTMGEIPQLILAGMADEARHRLEAYRDVFGEENFYVELQDHGLPEQKTINTALRAMAEQFSLPMIATNACYYVDKEDARIHDIMLCIQSGRTVDDAQRPKFRGEEYYFKSVEEMRSLFEEIPEALSNTVDLAKRVACDFEFDTYHFPSFQLPEGKTLDEELIEEANAGLEQRFKIILDSIAPKEREQEKQRYQERLNRELTIINKMGFGGYFLIVADFIRFAKTEGIPVGPGRGSAAGSLVAYALQITDIDPLPYDLLFERFLNPERISMPDIDIDFCIRGRDRVIQYVAEKYQGDTAGVLDARVAQIITFGKMKARAVIRDVGRVLNMPYGEVDRIAKLVPFAINITLKEAFEQEPQFEELRQAQPHVDELLNIAERLEGFVRHASTHAAGVVISDDRPLTDHMPLFKGSEGEVTTQYDMKMVEALGLIKFDFLGLKTLTVLQRAVDLIKEHHGVDIDLNNLDLKDGEVFHLLSKGNTTGIFQLESSGMRDLIVRLKPSKFEDIIALVALYRPGPLGSGMVDDFIERKHGFKPIEYELPQLKDVLEETYGVILYQEQVMQIAVQLANYSMADADILRKAMGKKIPEVLMKQKEKFVGGAVSNGVQDAKVEKLFDLIVQFGGYGFNKSHSAAYALIAYQTAYLKAHYPVEFMTALLSEDLGNTDKVINYITDCHALGIDVLPPSVNTSRWDFEAMGEKIRFGLGAVKNVGEGAIEGILKERDDHGEFEDIVDFAKRVDLNRVNRKVVEALIKCGAFDSSKQHRAQMFAAVNRLLDYGNRQQEQRETGQVGLFDTPGSESANIFPDVEEWDDKTKLNFEKEAVGFYLTGHPLGKFQRRLSRLGCLETENLSRVQDKKQVLLGAMVSQVKEITTKKGRKMAFVTFEDLRGTVEGVVFSDTYQASTELLRSGEPLCVRATVDQGEDRTKLLVDKVAFLSEAEKALELKVTVSISKNEANDDKLERLKQVFESYHGDMPVSLELELEDGRMVALTLPEKNWVNLSEPFFEAAESILGTHDSVRVSLQ